MEDDLVVEEDDDEVDLEYTDEEKKRLIEHSTGMIGYGNYIKIVLPSMKFKHYKSFGDNPLLVHFATHTEDNMGFLMVRMKKHRYYSNILKSYDPLIINVGFKKYQSIPVFARKDDNERLRMVKYTPQHDFCLAYFYGPYSDTKVGVTAFQSISSDLKKFRVAATGTVLGFAPQYQIMKKLKLIGEPFKIMKNTAFVKGMFNSRMELSKFLGAKIRTVSGIRG